MRLPDFLIIGAMKAGTTSLYRDLLTNPSVFMPARKEPNSLCRDDVLTDAGRGEYAEHFAPAAEEQLCGEASTAYTKLPDFPGVPERARRVLGPEVRVIYLVREPVSRIVSHHHHAVTAGRVSEPIDRAVHVHSMFVGWSRYAMQATPWLDTFGADRVRIVLFEDYVAARRATIEDLSRFLGITPRPELVDVEAVYNKGDNKPVARGPAKLVQRNPLYQRYLRRLLPLGARDRLRRAFFPRADARPAPPSPETVRWLIGRVREDSEKLRVMLGRSSDLWDFGAVERKYSDTAHRKAARAGA